MKDMAKDDDKGLDAIEKMGVDERMTQALEARWDPSKMSRFMRASEGSRAQRLDASQRSRFEGRLGVDLSEVRIFSGELAQEITRAHGAEALTIGDTGMILMRNSAAFAPGTAAGTSLLAHELTHVAQAKPNIAFKKPSRGSGTEEEEEAEEEAEEEERRVLEEEMGAPPQQTDAEKDEGDKERKDKIRAKVFELLAEDQWIEALRSGVRHGGGRFGF
jgi:hypothetical protein